MARWRKRPPASFAHVFWLAVRQKPGQQMMLRNGEAKSPAEAEYASLLAQSEWHLFTYCMREGGVETRELVTKTRFTTRRIVQGACWELWVKARPGWSSDPLEAVARAVNRGAMT